MMYELCVLLRHGIIPPKKQMKSDVDIAEWQKFVRESSR